MTKYITMNIKNIPFKPKKIPYYLSLILLTVGASLILGFLSFGGMYALLPVLSVAFAAFGLSVIYEGEIYLQNIKGALGKLFKTSYLEKHLAKDYLLNNFPETNACPQFFKDYKAQLKLLEAFGHKELNKDSKQRKKQIEKTLKDMEKWLALQLFPGKDTTRARSKYATELQDWLVYQAQIEWQEKLEKRRFQFSIVKGFSLLSAIFMGLGSTYLIVEAFSVIPLMAAVPFGLWPIFILPMAIIAGSAYGLLTYNAITDMINNNTIAKWYSKIRDDLSKGLTLRNVFITATALVLVGLALALTICTAGTWWTIATNARPLFDWMRKMPSFIMGALNPFVTGISAIFFNAQNSTESLGMIVDALEGKNMFLRIRDSVIDGYHYLIQTENMAQIFNPFRLILKLTITPLRILLFFGHLLSIAVTADRMPGMPQIISALIAIISEGFEDAHYFAGHSHEEDHHKPGDSHHHDTKAMLREHLDSEAGHEHGMDIPTWVLKTAAAPLYALAALWDVVFSSRNTPSAPDAAKEPRILTFSEAWNKQRGIEPEEHVTVKENAKRPSVQWQKEQVIALIEKHEAKNFSGFAVNAGLVKQKIAQLRAFKEKVQSANAEELATILEEEKENSIYNQHRLFCRAGEKTSTQVFVDELPVRVGLR